MKVKLHTYKKLLLYICILGSSTAVSQTSTTDVKQLKSFPSKRLNYMFNQYVLPTLYSSKEFDMFVHAQYYGEGKPLEDGVYWAGFRSLQGYKFRNNTNMSIMADIYKNAQYGIPQDFRMYFAFGYGYNAKFWGIHAGVYTGLAILPEKLLSNQLLAMGPVPLVESTKLSGTLDYYLYYKVTNIAKLKTIFRDRVRDPLTNVTIRQRGLSVFGANLYDMFNVEYYRFEKTLLLDTRARKIAEKVLDKDFSYGGDFWARFDTYFQIEFDRLNKATNYALAPTYRGKRFEYGLDISKKSYTNSRLGGMIIWNLLSENNSLFDEGWRFRVVAFSNYTPLVFEMHSQSAIFLELRIKFGS